MLWAQLDKRYPKAESRQIVEFEGRRYQRRFTPVSKSLSGKTVKEWAKSWLALGEPTDKTPA